MDFSVPTGSILGLLGPNGAGKTTAVRILTTLARPDAGRGTVAGIDVVAHPAEVRRHIGVAAQDATLDGLLTGRQNLVLVGELSDMGRAAVPGPGRPSCWTQFELTDAADRVLKGYSGGMRRRLDLAASLMTRPRCCSSTSPRRAWTRRAASGCGRPSGSCCARASRCC